LFSFTRPYSTGTTESDTTVFLFWVRKFFNQHEHDSSEVNVFHSISHDNIYGPFLFAEKSINGNMLINGLNFMKISFPSLKKKPEMEYRITEAMVSVTSNTEAKVWEETHIELVSAV
jgi:hypothetical protein